LPPSLTPHPSPLKPRPAPPLQVPAYCRAPTRAEDDAMHAWIANELRVRCHATRLHVPCDFSRGYDAFVPCEQELMNNLAGAALLEPLSRPLSRPLSSPLRRGARLGRCGPVAALSLLPHPPSPFVDSFPALPSAAPLLTISSLLLLYICFPFRSFPLSPPLPW